MIVKTIDTTQIAHAHGITPTVEVSTELGKLHADTSWIPVAVTDIPSDPPDSDSTPILTTAAPSLPRTQGAPDTEEVEQSDRIGQYISSPQAALRPEVPIRVTRVWDGVVTKMSNRTFEGEFVERGKPEPRLSAEFQRAEVEPDERELLKLGALFEITLSRARLARRWNTMTELRFRRLPNFSPAEIDGALKAARERRQHLQTPPTWRPISSRPLMTRSRFRFSDLELESALPFTLVADGGPWLIHVGIALALWQVYRTSMKLASIQLTLLIGLSQLTRTTITSQGLRKR
jgi:hypothetical protein